MNAQLGRPAGASGRETRKRIIAATMQSVARVGYARTTMREIARAANVTSANLYNYFPSKSDLIQATIAARAEIAHPRLRRAAECPGTAVDRIEAIIDESDRLIEDYPDMAAFEFAIRNQTDVVVDPQNHSTDDPVAFRVMREVVQSVIDDAWQQGALAEGVDPQTAVEVIYALLHGLTELAATGSREMHHAALQTAKRLVRGNLFS